MISVKEMGQSNPWGLNQLWARQKLGDAAELCTPCQQRCAQSPAAPAGTAGLSKSANLLQDHLLALHQADLTRQSPVFTACCSFCVSDPSGISGRTALSPRGSSEGISQS